MADEEVVAQAGTVAPDSIPPADSNEQLRIAHDKREAAFQRTVAGERRAAAAADVEEEPEATRRTPPQGRTARPGRQQTAD